MTNLKFLLIPLLLVLSACQIKPPLTDIQRRAIQVRTWQNSSYDNVFRAAKTVMQDEGYVIKNQDMAGGLITGTVNKAQGGSPGGLFLTTVVGNANGNTARKTNEEFEVSCNLEEINKTTSETRLTIQRKDTYSTGASSGEVILEPEMYQKFYQKLATEIERRKAQGKK